jgi:hypothetical protein
MLLKPAHLGTHLGCDEEGIGLVRKDDIDVPASGARNRDLDERPPARSNGSKELLDDLALDPIVDPGTGVGVRPDGQIGTEHIGDPDENSRAGFGCTLLDAAQVARADADRSRNGRLGQSRILAKAAKLPADRLLDQSGPFAALPFVFSCAQPRLPAGGGRIHRQ